MNLRTRGGEKRGMGSLKNLGTLKRLRFQAVYHNIRFYFIKTVQILQQDEEMSIKNRKFCVTEFLKGPCSWTSLIGDTKAI